MKKEITKRIPSKKAVTLMFEIYEGFSDIEELETQMCTLELYEKQYMAVYFNGNYYGVVNQSLESALVVGKKVTWIKDSNIWNKEETSNAQLPFKPGRLFKGAQANSEILRDLMEIDPDFKVLNGYKTGWKDIRDSYQYASHFAELLGRTFYTTFFTRETLHALSLYDPTSVSSLAVELDNQRIQGINPFRTEALYTSGKTHRILL